MADIHEKLRDLYRSFNERDMEAVIVALHPEVAWPNGWEGGYVYGHQGVRDYWKRQWDAIDPYVEPVSITSDPHGDVVVRVKQVVRDKQGQVLSDGIVEHVFRFEDGLVKTMEIRNV